MHMKTQKNETKEERRKNLAVDDDEELIKDYIPQGSCNHRRKINKVAFGEHFVDCVSGEKTLNHGTKFKEVPKELYCFLFSFLFVFCGRMYIILN